MSNELPFLKRKLPFLYKNFAQIILVDYDMFNKSNSKDGTLEYIESYADVEKKITLIKDFNPNAVSEYRGVSYKDKQKMFAKASRYINHDVDVVWATDLDEFFEERIIRTIEEVYRADSTVVSIDIPHTIFAYNQYNIFNSGEFYISPRITKHRNGFIYGHCDFASYGKTIRLNRETLYHFAFIGLARCDFKINKIYTDLPTYSDWLTKYKLALSKGDKYVDLPHPNRNIGMRTIKYDGKIPEYIDGEMFEELNNIDEECDRIFECYGNDSNV